MRSAEERRRSLLTYAFISHTLADQRDILLGLVPLFRPIAEAESGQLFSPKRFVDLVAARYGLSMHPFVAEEMVPRLLNAGLLTTQGENLKQGSYLFKAAERSASDKTSEDKVETSLDTVLSKFKDFVGSFPTLLNLHLSRDDLGNILFDWLIASETRGAEDFILTSGNQSDDQERAATRPTYRFRNESDYLCARFVSDLEKNDSSLFDELAKISAGAMVSEVVLDLKNPPEVGRTVKDLTVLLDGPFAMDVLALTGRERHENAIYIFNSLKSMGARLATFEHSCDEIAGNLRGVLKNPPHLRTGPTGDALRRAEVVEAYVVEVLKDIEGFLRKQDVSVLAKAIATPPQDDRFFTDDQITSFGNTLVGWGNEIARERDMLSIALVMRRRRGYRSTDLFESKYVFLSHNPALVRHARNFCLEEFLIREEQVGPAVDQRRMAVLLWLTLGSAQRLALSRAQLIANCANALRSRPDVIQSMRDMLGKVKPELKPQFDALLTRPRSVQVVMDLTLGVREVVGPDQIEQVFQIVKNSAVEAERAVFEGRIKDVREKLGKTITVKDTLISSMQEQNVRIRDEISEARALDRGMLKSWAESVARRGWRLDRSIRIAISAVVAVILTAAALTGSSAGGIYWALPSAVIAFVGTIWGLWIHDPAPLTAFIRRWQDRQLRRIAEQSGREDLLPYAEVDWATLSVSWYGRYASDSDNRRLEDVGSGLLDGA